MSNSSVLNAQASEGAKRDAERIVLFSVEYCSTSRKYWASNPSTQFYCAGETASEAVTLLEYALRNRPVDNDVSAYFSSLGGDTRRDILHLRAAETNLNIWQTRLGVPRSVAPDYITAIIPESGTGSTEIIIAVPNGDGKFAVRLMTKDGDYFRVTSDLGISTGIAQVKNEIEPRLVKLRPILNETVNKPSSTAGNSSAP